MKTNELIRNRWVGRITGARWCGVAVMALLLAGQAWGTTATKQSTGTDLTQAASWSGGSGPGYPTSADVATWTSAAGSLGTGLTLGSDMSWGGILVSGAANDPIAITGAGILTLGASGIDMSASTVNMSMANPIALSAGQSWKIAQNRMLTVSGSISAGSVTLTNVGTGELKVDAATAVLPSTLTLAMSSGTFNYDNSAANGTRTPTLAALSDTGGDHTVKLTGRSGQTTTLTFTGTVPTTAGVTRNFVVTPAAGNGSDSKIVFSGQAAGIIGLRSFYNGSSYAFYDSGNYVRALNYAAVGGDANTKALSTSSTTFTAAGANNKHVDLDTSGSITAADSETIYSLRIGNNSANPVVAIAATKTLSIVSPSINTVISGGILKAGGGTAATISGGTGIQVASARDLAIRCDTASDLLTISSPILANVQNLVKGGAGTLTLSGGLNYTSGQTYITGGTLLMNCTKASGGNWWLYNGATLAGTGTINCGSGLRLIWNSGGTILLGSSGATLTHVSGTVPTISVGAILKIAPTSASTLDKFVHQAASGTFQGISIIDLIVDTTALNGQSLNNQTILQTTGGATITAGTSFRSVTINNGYTYSVANSGTAITLTLTAPTPTKLAVTSVPANATVGQSFSVTVQAQDNSGNPAVVSQNTGISLSVGGATDGTLSGNTGTILQGTSSVTLTGVQYTKAETITLTAARTSGDVLTTSAASSSFPVNAGNATKLQILLPGETAAPGTVSGKTWSPDNQTTGAAIVNGIRVNAVDANWNRVSSATPNVTITSTDGAATKADDNGGTAGNMTLVAGSNTLSSFTFNTGGGQTITASDAASVLTSDTSPSVTVISGGAATRTWNGASSGPGDDNWSTTANWVNGTAPSKVSGTDNVAFDGTTRLQPNLDDNYNIGSLTFSNTAGSFTLVAAAGKALTITSGDVMNNSPNTQTLGLPVTRPFAQAFNAVGGDIVVSNVISGAALTKSGSSNLVLSADNDYTGGTTINAGTLQLGDGVVRNGSVLGTIVNGATLAIANPADQTVSNVISGIGAVTKSGAGVATLTGANTYGGSSTLSAGTVNLGVAQNAAVSGPLGANGTISLAGGALQYSAVNQTDYSLRFSTAAGQQYKVDNNGQAVTWAAGLTSSGGTLTKSGAGTLTLTGTNTYAGGTTISGGTLQLGDGTSGKDGTVAGDITDNAALAFNYAGSKTNSGIISGSGSVSKSGAGTLTLSGNSSYGGGTTVSGGRLNVNHNNALGNGAVSLAAGTMLDNTSGGSVTITNAVTVNGNLAYAGTTNLTQQTGAVTLSAPAVLAVTNTLAINGAISGGANSLSKAGSGTLVLGNNNAFSGGMTVSAGTLVINHNNALGSGTLTISGGTLDNQSGGLVTIDNAVAWDGNFTFTGTTNLTQQTGAVTLNGNRKVTVSANTLALNGVVSGAGCGLAKAGAGTLVLGNANNTYDGTLAVSNGTVVVVSLADSGTGCNGTGAIGMGEANSTVATLTYMGSGVTLSRQISWVSVGLNVANKLVFNNDGSGPLVFTANPFYTGGGSGGSSQRPSITLGGANTGTVAGAIADCSLAGGTLSVIKQGTGAWTLSGNNTYSYGTTLSAGTLNLGHANALGTGTLTVDGGTTLDNTSGGPLTITNALTLNGSFTFTGTQPLTQQTGAISMINTPPTLTIGAGGTLTLNGVISGNWNLTKAGVGTLALGGANTFAGVLSVNNGTLALTTINNNNANGPLGNSANAVNLGSSGLSATLQFTGTGTSDKGFTLVTGGTGTFEVVSGTLTLGGVLTSGGTVNKTGAGTLVVTNTASTYSGALSVKAGTLSVPTVNNASANGPLGNNANAVTLGASGATATLEYTGNTASSTKKFTLATSATGVFQVDTAGQILTLSGIIDGAGNLTKTGAGTLALSATNTYTGNTTVSAGTLQPTGIWAISNSPQIAIASGATLDVSVMASGMPLGAGQQLRTTATGSDATATIKTANGKNLTLSANGLVFAQYDAGGTAPLTVDGATAGSLDLNGAPVTVTTTIYLDSGSHKLIAKTGAGGVTGIPGPLTINGMGGTGELVVRNGELFLNVTSGTTFRFR